MGLFSNRLLLHRVIPTMLGLLLVFAALWVQQTDRPGVADLRDRLEWIAYDLRFDLTRPFADVDPPAPVVIVDIDEASLAELGRWPWPRALLGELSEQMYNAGAIAVGWDVVFAEPERNIADQLVGHLELPGNGDPEAAELAERVQALAADLDGDARFAEGLARGEAILGYHFSTETERIGELGPPVETAAPLPLGRTRIPEVEHYVGNLPQLQAAAAGGGFFTILPDADGTLRNYNLLMGHDGEIYPSLALSMASHFLFADELGVETATSGGREVITALDVGGMNITTTADGAVGIPYRGTAGAFEYVSATDVLHGRIGDELAGALVLVGTTAQGLYDLRTTPLQSAYPGVEVHANVLAGLLAERFPYTPDWADALAFLFLLGLGVLLALGLPWLRPGLLVVVTIGAALSVVAGNVGLWTAQQWVLPLALPVVMLLLLGMLNMAWGFLFEERSKRQLQGMFGQYVPPALVSELADNPDGLNSMEGDRREMTVLFCDIRSFTTISEGLEPGELKDMLNRYFTPMTQLIFENRGTVDKYVGDMIMAFWGAPLEDPDHARHALITAMAMLEESERLKPELKALGYPELNIGIGLNSGPMSVGNMGSEYRRAYTVLGDSVNLASRLEGLTKFYGVQLVVGDDTRAGQDDFLFRTLDRVQVKGKDEPVAIHEPVGLRAELDPAVIAAVETHEAAVAAYRARDWETARSLFTELQANDPGRVIYGLYLERMKLIDPATLPDDWDGVFRHTSK